MDTNLKPDENLWQLLKINVSLNDNLRHILISSHKTQYYLKYINNFDIYIDNYNFNINNFNINNYNIKI